MSRTITSHLYELGDIHHGLQRSGNQKRARSATHRKFEQVSASRRTEPMSDLRGIFADHTDHCTHFRPQWPPTSQARAGRKPDACGVFTGSEVKSLDQVPEGLRVDQPVVRRLSVSFESSTIVVGSKCHSGGKRARARPGPEIREPHRPRRVRDFLAG
ncbi:uncharacterized protein SCHCODRAFT_02149096 [Schizophyllum commune H4-8]|uniref:uncharacterized protein n=1 Tax=Schizophyllum commune (strain H4-8 / FGSC 9210) TaxID=578458 RepID=UPI002160E64B|nr:uncharacterized protein SCHCODRAFT_02149096 [Schizophyllum commune H4-8]KAI5897777.1 hypothetical protein SCHCODRAFT_02149096 [Schizophyllum commune H4-8]